MVKRTKSAKKQAIGKKLSERPKSVAWREKVMRIYNREKANGMTFKQALKMASAER